jgi:energy-coupling factor transporter ATP-binding protein EcfA2
MRLTNIEYSEYPNNPSSWHLSATALGQVSLIVGKNSAGKTRLLSVIGTLTKLITGAIPQLFKSAHYIAEFKDGVDTYIYEIQMNESLVIKESLARNGSSLMQRGPGGMGTIYSEKQKETIEFQSPAPVVAAYVKRDEIQHPFLEVLYKWGDDLRHYTFGTSFGREHLFQVTDFYNDKLPPNDPRMRLLVMVYKLAFIEFQEAFDLAIMADMKLLGYNLQDVGVEAIPLTVPGLPSLMGVFCKEADLQTKTNQLTMSAGMFRALALVVYINDCIFRNLKCTILIDDIGEGLDYSRSQAFVDLLIERAAANSFQLVMTTNDRFVMNGVSLDHWGVMTRVGSDVRVVNKQNSPEVFSRFDELGLNNFDFFSSGFFENGLSTP